MRVCLISSSVKKKPDIVHLTIGRAQFLPCSPETNIPLGWRFHDSILPPGPRHTALSQGLIIRPSSSDSGLYTCETVETVKGKMHRKTVVQYLVQVQDTDTLVRNLKAAGITLAAVTCLLMLLICSALLIRHLKAKEQNHICRGNENGNNNRVVTVSPFCHHDQTTYRSTGEGPVHCDQADERHTGANSGGDAATEEEQNVEAGSVLSILILPEGTVAKVAAEEVEAYYDHCCAVTEITD